jgi:cell division septation protein DedD
VTISIASFRTEERARTVAAQLVDAGFPAFVRPRGDGLWQQVIVGPYVSREEAAAAQQAMAAQGVQGTEVRIEKTDLQP